MKKTMIAVAVAGLLVGCKTADKLFDAAQVAAEAAPAVIEDGRSLTDKIGDAWAKLRSLWSPTTNAPVAAAK